VVLLFNLKRRIRLALEPYPLLFLPLARFGKEGDRARVDKDTDFVIEGFPRSGNSFAVAAFRMAQPRPVRLAHHLHAPAQIIAAARRRLPILVLIREPVAAVSSLVIRHPEIPLKMALQEYIRFYKTAAPYRRQFVIGLFDEVTSDFGEVIRRVNRRFSTDFGFFEHNETNVQKSFAIIEQKNRERNNGALAELRIARPSQVREKLKTERHLAPATAKHQRLVAEAQSLYHDFAKQAELEKTGLRQERF
jgi:hypothetical protein